MVQKFYTIIVLFFINITWILCWKNIGTEIAYITLLRVFRVLIINYFSLSDSLTFSNKDQIINWIKFYILANFIFVILQKI